MLPNRGLHREVSDLRGRVTSLERVLALLGAGRGEVADSLEQAFSEYSSGLDTPRCRISQNALEILPNATWTELSFVRPHVDVGTFQVPDDAWFDNADPTRIVVPVGLGGDYVVGGGCRFATNADGAREMSLANINKGLGGMSSSSTGEATRPVLLTSAVLLRLEDGADVRLRAFQNSGGNLNADAKKIWAVRIR